MKWIFKNEKGFTLFETLVSLLVSSFVVLLLTGGILHVAAIRETMTSNAQETNRSQVITGDRQVEWHIFLNQLENYLQDTFEPRVTTTEFVVNEIQNSKRGYRQVLYSRDSNRSNFSRKADNGNHRLLTGLETLTFKNRDGWLLLAGTFKNGDQYKGQIWIESWVEKEEAEEEIEEEVTTTNDEGIETELLEEEESADKETQEEISEEMEITDQKEEDEG